MADKDTECSLKLSSLCVLLQTNAFEPLMHLHVSKILHWVKLHRLQNGPIISFVFRGFKVCSKMYLTTEQEASNIINRSRNATFKYLNIIFSTTHPFLFNLNIFRFVKMSQLLWSRFYVLSVTGNNCGEVHMKWWVFCSSYLGII